MKIIELTNGVHICSDCYEDVYTEADRQDFGSMVHARSDDGVCAVNGCVVEAGVMVESPFDV